MIDSESFFAQYINSPKFQKTQSDQRLITLNPSQIRLSPDRKKTTFLAADESAHSKTSFSQTIRQLLKSSQDLTETLRDKNISDCQIQYLIRKFKNDYDSVSEIINKRSIDQFENLAQYKEQILHFQAKINDLEDKCRHRKICLKKLNDIINQKDEEIDQLKQCEVYAAVVEVLAEHDYYRDQLQALAGNLSCNRYKDSISKIKLSLSQDLENSKALVSLQMKVSSDDLPQYFEKQLAVIQNLQDEISQMNEFKYQTQQYIELLEQQEQEIEQLTQQLNENVQVIEAIKQQLSSKNAEVELFRKESAQIRHESLALKEDNQQLQSNLQQHEKELLEYQQVMSQYQQLQQQQDAKLAEFLEMQSEVHALRDQLKQKSAELQEYEGNLEELQEIFQSQKDQIKSLQEATFNSDRELAQKLEQKDQEVHKLQLSVKVYESERLESHEQKLKLIEAHKMQVENLQQDLQISKSTTAQKEHLLNQEKVANIQLSEKLSFKSAQIETLENQLEDLNRELDAQDQKITVLEESTQKKDAMIAELILKESFKDHQIQQLESQILKIKSILQQSQLEKLQQDDAIKSYNEQIVELEQRISDYQRKSDLMQNCLDESNLKLIQATQQLELLHAEILRQKQQKNSLEEIDKLNENLKMQVQQLQELSSQKEKDFEATLQAYKQEKEEELYTQLSQIYKLEESAEVSEKRIKKLESELVLRGNAKSKLEEELKQAQQIVASQKVKLESGQSDLQEMTQQLNQKNKIIKDLQAELSELQNASQNANLKLSDTQSRLSQLIQKEVQSQQALNNLRDELSQVQKEHSSQAKKVEFLKKKNAEDQDTIKNLSECVEQERLRKQELQESNLKLKQQVSESKLRLDESFFESQTKEQHVSQLEQKLAQMQKQGVELSAKKAQVSMLSQEVESQKQQLSQFKAENVKLEQKVQQFEKFREESFAVNRNLTFELEQVRTQYAILEQSYIQLDQEKQNLTVQIHNLSQQNSQILETSMLDHEAKVAKYRETIQTLKADLKQMQRNQDERDHQFAVTVKQYHNQHQEHNQKMAEMNRLLKERNEEIQRLKTNVEDVMIRSQIMRMKDETQRRLICRLVRSIDPFSEPKVSDEVENLLELAVEKVQGQLKQRKKQGNTKENDGISQNSQNEKALFNLELSNIVSN